MVDCDPGHPGGSWRRKFLGRGEHFGAKPSGVPPPPVSPPDPLSQGPKMLRLGAAAKIEIDFHKTANSDYIADLNVILML